VTNKTKVVLIGVDGGTLDLIEPWVQQGKLPTFEQIIKKGVYGNLRSTTPYYSAPAWVSMVTGCQPGKHGIYDFFRTDTCVKNIVNSRMRKVPAIWNMLTGADKESIVVNVPGTYPPEKIKGIMITGLLTPSLDSEYTYPKEIKNQLRDDRIGSYLLEQVAVDDIPKNLTARYAPEKFANQVNELTTSHGIVTMNLMKDFSWDFTMVVFRGTDDIQHLLWNRKDLILSCYQKADEYIGKMIKTYPEAIFIIVSDHGFGTPKKYFYVNNALYNKGYIKTNSNPSINLNTIIAMLFDKLSRIIFHVVPMQRIVRSKMGRKFILSTGSASSIDMNHTIAMYHSVCSRGIRINLKEKYPQGYVDKKDYDRIKKELTVFLQSIKDPDSGEAIIKNIYDAKDIYGEHAANDPLDIIFDLKEEYSAQELLQPLEGIRSALSSRKKELSILSKPGFYDWIGDHRPNGIFFMYGKQHIANKRVDASIMDIVPTILALQNVPIPKNIDGNVITDAFTHRPEITHSESYITKETKLMHAERSAIKKLKEKI
jgi:predicted AlkP superfamily phosphohydrolase/phosphomutase